MYKEHVSFILEDFSQVMCTKKTGHVNTWFTFVDASLYKVGGIHFVFSKSFRCYISIYIHQVYLYGIITVNFDIKGVILCHAVKIIQKK
ncbi:hypothetical protein HMPREF2800_01955 [Anaerosphaera sp. HMSC064C01]|nr:hypothetical protein HMPREF2800_01955 [Anaerosphaera sp. HMSC064C01]